MAVAAHRVQGQLYAYIGRLLGVLDQLALTLKQHSGIRLRLEGHVNSKCGLDCDGSSECTNNRCAALFRGRGGSVGFSLGRADAVAARYMSGARGPPLPRMPMIGRVVVEDTEGDLKHRNRRSRCTPWRGPSRRGATVVCFFSLSLSALRLPSMLGLMLR